MADSPLLPPPEDSGPAAAVAETVAVAEEGQDNAAAEQPTPKAELKRKVGCNGCLLRVC
jgi:hypothetical protein